MLYQINLKIVRLNLNYFYFMSLCLMPNDPRNLIVIVNGRPKRKLFTGCIKFNSWLNKTHNFSIFQLLRCGIICIHIPFRLALLLRRNSGNRLNNLCNAFITKKKEFYVLLIFIAFRSDWYWISNYKALRC